METANEAKIGKSRSLARPGRVHDALEPGESRSLGAATRSHTAGESRREPAAAGEQGDSTRGAPPGRATWSQRKGTSMKSPPGDQVRLAGQRQRERHWKGGRTTRASPWPRFLLELNTRVLGSPVWSSLLGARKGLWAGIHSVPHSSTPHAWHMAGAL